MRHIYGIVFLFIALQAQAQLETAHWRFGWFGGLNFTSGTASVATGNLHTNEGCASISDKCGNLLFYTDGKVVFSKDTSMMQNGNALLGDASSTQSAIIIPKADNPDIYYVFTTYSLNGLHYSVIDMSLNGGLGAVVAGQKNIPLALNGVMKGSEKLTAVAKADNSGYWVITHYLDSYYAFSVTAAGVNTTPVRSQVGVNIPDKINNKLFLTYAIGQLKVSPDGSKIAAAHFTAVKPSDFNLFPIPYFSPSCALAFTYGGVLGLYDFDNQTGVVSNESILNSLSNERRTYYGVEFSPDSKVLYSSYDVFNFAADCGDLYTTYKINAVIDKYDLTATAVPATENHLFQNNDPSKSLAGSLQLALDGNIYHAMYSSLSYISNPNNYAASVFHNSGIPLSQTTLGLPPFIASLFDPKILINGDFHTDKFCLGTLMKMSYEGCPDTIIGWDFGDGNTSTAISPAHTYANTGNYTITLTITAPDGSIKTKTRLIEIEISTPTFNAVPAICNGESLAALPTVSLEGITGTWSPALDNTQTTTYTFNPNAGECSKTQTLIITVNQKVTPTFNTITPICNGESLAALPTVSLEGISGTWSPALDNTQTTVYTFSPNVGECATTQTLTITVNQKATPTFNTITPICNGESLAALPTVSLEGIYGTWSPALDNTQTTVYTFSPNVGECATTQTLTINVNQKTTPTFNAVTAICSGESLAALPTISLDGITGTWSPALDNTQTTTYTFSPNVGECAATQTLTITVNQEVTPTFNAVTAICNGESLAALPTVSLEGISGTWSPALDNTQTTTYTFNPNASECATTQTLTINVNQKTTPTFNAVPAICNGESLAALPTASLEGISGIWSPMLDNTQTTTYTFNPNASECATTQTLTITVNQKVIPTFNAVTPICNGETMVALPTVSLEGISGTWSPALDNTQTTIYTFSPNASECATIKTLTITVNQKITPTFNAVTPICKGESLAALPTVSLEGISGTWSPALDNSQTTTYTFSPNAGECAIIQTLTITVNQKVTPTFNAVTPICNGEPLAALPTTSLEGITGSWSPVLDNSQTTTYTFTPDAGQCTTATVSLTIVVHPLITPIFTITPTYCQNAIPDVLPNISTNGITGTWFPTIINTSSIGTTIYEFSPTAGQCAIQKVSFPITVTGSDRPVFNLSTSYCQNTTPVILPNISDNGIIGIWHPASINTSVSGIQTYTFTAHPGSCSIVALQFELTVEVVAVTTPVFTILTDYYFIESPQPLPTVSDNGISGIWYPAVIEPSSSATGNYLFVPEADQCSERISIEINVIHYPKFFTPNNDGYHDTWNISALPNNAKILIYDRYGKILTSIRTQGFGWDGTYNGQQLPSDDYWFVLMYVNNEGLTKEFKSHFTLKR